MRQATIAMLAPVLLLAGCGTEDNGAPPTLMTEPVAAAARAGLRTSGRCEGTFELMPIDFLPAPFQDLAAHATIPNRGTCHILYLGKSTLAGEDLGDFTGDPFTFTGTRVFVAADGDELRATIEYAVPGPGPNDEFTSAGTLTFEGGTGRFRNAAGTAVFTGGGSSASGTNFLAFEGRLSSNP